MEAALIHADRWTDKRKEECDEDNTPFRKYAKAPKITSF
jgi:hypothetical protein